MAAVYLATAVLCLTVSSLRSFVDTAALSPSKESAETVPQIQDPNVQELESLKHSIGNTLKMMKTHSSMYTNIDGQKEAHSNFQEEMESNGNLLARVNQHVDSKSSGLNENPVTKIRTDVEIPSEGVHKSTTQNIAPENSNINEKRKTLQPKEYLNNNLDKFNPYSGIQYTPLDMAEYVFWTGDEKGVTLGIEEFLQQGLMTREEAIAFLQEIKYNLDYLQNHYTQLGLNLQERFKDRENNFIKPSSSTKTSKSYPERPELSTSFDLGQLRQETTKKSSLNSMSEIGKETGERNLEKNQSPVQTQNDEEYDELLERLRLADFLYTEYSLEEVIYQLAKVMFTQSLTRGNAEAQKALQKFTGFLEAEAEQGHISRALEKKVLDVLIASLTDTITENPELISAARDSLASQQSYAEKQQVIRKIIELGTDDKENFETYKDKNDRTTKINLQLKENNLKHSAPIGFGKYNTS